MKMEVVNIVYIKLTKRFTPIVLAYLTPYNSVVCNASTIKVVIFFILIKPFFRVFTLYLCTLHIKALTDTFSYQFCYVCFTGFFCAISHRPKVKLHI